MYKDALDEVVDTWHDIYGVIPDPVRKVLNNRTFTIIGAAYGGLGGAALGAALDEAVQRVRHRSESMKRKIESEPNWKKDFYTAIDLDYSLREIFGTGSCLASKVNGLWERLTKSLYRRSIA